MYVYGRRHRSLALPLLLALVLVVLGGGAYQLTRTVPAIAVTSTVPERTEVGTAVLLPLPSAGSFAVAVGELGMVVENGSATPRPIASVAKMMTAYLILQDYPLQPGESGPSVTITTENEARYLEMILQDESAVPVTAGTTLSEFQMLQGLLIPSANNFAEMLAVWDAGSEEAFVARMNATAQSLGMTATRYVDASGLSQDTVSTATDQLRLAGVLMTNPVFASIVSTLEVSLPGSGTFPNTNQLLGRMDVVGIKTGFTEEAGGNLAFAARRTIGEEVVDITGVVLGQPTRADSFTVSGALIDSVADHVQWVTVIEAGTKIGELHSAWAGPVALVVSEGLSLLAWPGTTLETAVTLDPIKAPLNAGTQVGWLEIRLGEQERRIPIVLSTDLASAGTFWRLFRF